MRRHLLAYLGLFGLPLLASCGGSDGQPGAAGASCTASKQGSVTVIQCVGGSEVPVNDGADGTPGGDGADGTDGDPGHSVLTRSSVEDAGDNCDNGGTLVEYGVDEDDNDTLGDGEVSGSYYVCDSDAGADGDVGPEGTRSLVLVTNDNVTCANGGQKIESGLDDGSGSDTAGDGVLGPDEVQVTEYACNGSDGADGAPFPVLVRTSDEPAGLNCGAGGQRIEVGDDSGSGAGTANDGELDDDEVDGTAYLCAEVDLSFCSGITVMNTNDSGPASLRQAVADANGTAGADTICVPPGHYLLSSGNLVLSESVNIQGYNARSVIIDGNDASNVFTVSGGVAATFDNLTITRGFATDFIGGGIHVEGSATVVECTVSDNHATFGGGMRLDSAAASAFVYRSTFSDNSGFGSAIESQQGSITIENSTLSGNAGGGGVVRLSNDGLLSVRSSTVYLNETGLLAGGGAATLRLGGSILAGVATGPLTNGPYDDEGGNFTGADPKLGALANNGGPTDTHAPAADSDVIDTGSNPASLDTDQRGFARVFNGTADSGAVEYGDGAP